MSRKKKKKDSSAVADSTSAVVSKTDSEQKIPENEQETEHLHTEKAEHFQKTDSKKEDKETHLSRIRPEQKKSFKAEQEAKKEHQKPETHPDESNSSRRKQKFMAVFLIFTGLFALGFIVFFLFGKIFRPQYLAEFLPASRTVAVLEIDIDSTHDQLKKLQNLLEKYPVYKKENIIRTFQAFFPQYDLDNMPYTWFGRRAGAAFLINAKNAPEPLFFIESTTPDDALSFFKEQEGTGLTASHVNGFSLYQLKKKNITFALLKKYVVFGDKKLLEFLLQAQDNQTPKLYDDADYRKIANNLPQGSLAFGYFHQQKILDLLSKDVQFMKKNGTQLQPFRPFLQLFTAEGFTVFAEQNHITLQSFTTLNQAVIKEQDFLTYNEKYAGDLLNFANEETVFFAGGHDLTKELKRLGELFHSATDSPVSLFEAVLQGQKDRYFGSEIDLEKDLYPLLQGEYLLTIEDSFEKPVITVFLQLRDKKKNLELIDKAVDAFIFTGGIFSPKPQDVTLPDGTKGREIIASSEEIDKSDEKHENIVITTLRIGDTRLFIYFATLDNRFVISNSKEALKKIIDRYLGKFKQSLRNSNTFQKNTAPLLRTADEVVSMNLETLAAFLHLEKNPYFEPFHYFTLTKNYFKDGISTFYKIEIL